MRRENANLRLPSLRGALATTCPPKLDERRRKQSILSSRGGMDCFASLAMTVSDIRVTQYSRDADDRTEKPRRTRMRGYDSSVWSGYRYINCDINDIGRWLRTWRPPLRQTSNIAWRFCREWPKACLSHPIPSGHVARASYRDGSFDRWFEALFNVSGAAAPMKV
jgi:hypothetical protein